jgi:DNA-binding IclR family transcriptional regulator
MGNGIGGVAAPAPAVAYAIRLLQLLRSASPEQLGVSELARRLGLGKASTHRILTTLVDEGCLILNPVTKAYSLGPALISLGHTASGSADVLEAVRSVLPALAEQSRLAATAFRALPNGRLVAVANVTAPGPFHVAQPLGASFPLAPPMGTLEFAFASEAKLEALVAWAEAKDLLGSSLDREALFQDIVDIRDQGFAWSVAYGENIDAGRTDVHSWLKSAEAHGLTRKTSLGREHYLSQIERYAALAPEASRGAPAPLFGLAVPIFDVNGDHVLHLTIHGFLNQAPPDRVSELAALTKQAASEAMAVIGGREPSAQEFARI